MLSNNLGKECGVGSLSSLRGEQIGGGISLESLTSQLGGGGQKDPDSTNGKINHVCIQPARLSVLNFSPLPLPLFIFTCIYSASVF